MKLRIRILSGGKKEEIIEAHEDLTYEELLESLHINPEIVIVFRKGTPVPLDERVSRDDIDIMRVVTGGNR